MSKLKKETWDGKAVPPERWGKDHRTTLLYLETRCVDYAGKVEPQHMRSSDSEYPTRLGDGVLLVGHDDYACIVDFEAAGLLRNLGTGLHPLVALTDEGWQAAWKLRRERASARADQRLGAA